MEVWWPEAQLHASWSNFGDAVDVQWLKLLMVSLESEIFKNILFTQEKYNSWS